MAADEVVKAPSCNIQASSNPNNDSAAAQAQQAHQEDVTTNAKTSATSSSSTRKNYFDQQWEEEVARATAMAQSALNYEQLELEQEQQKHYSVHFDTLQSWSGGNAFQSNHFKKLMIPTMTPLDENFFSVNSNNSSNQVIQNMLPIIGPGTSAALSEAARRMEREAASYTNPEVDVLQEESDLIVRLTRCISQSLNKVDGISTRNNLNACIEIDAASATSNNALLSSKMKPLSATHSTPAIRAEHEAILDQLDVEDIINVESAFDTIRAVGQFAPRRVCQHPFRKNDIVWVCRTCQADETCVLCHACWSDSDHVGHDASFYHAQAGGCCDCGDPDAWDKRGFCSHHGCQFDAADDPLNVDPNGYLQGVPWRVVAHTRGTVGACLDWLVEEVAVRCHSSFVSAFDDGGSDDDDDDDMKGDEDDNSEMDVSNNNNNNTATITATTPIDIDLPSTHTVLTSNTLTIAQAAAVASVSVSASTFHTNTNNNNNKFTLNNADDDDDDDDNSSKSTASDTHYTQVAKQSAAHKLATLGRAEHGLYLILHGSDVISQGTMTQAIQTLYRSAAGTSTIKKIVQVTQSSVNGDVVLLGTFDLLHATGPTPSITLELWRDGDDMTLHKIGSTILEWAQILSSAGVPCSIKTHKQLRTEQQAHAALAWLSHTARSCDALCRQISLATSQVRHLAPMLHADLRLPRRITRAYHALQLTLLAVPDFKKRLADVYCDAYEKVTEEYARGVGVAECSSYTLSVQFLNRKAYVLDLAENRGLLNKLVTAFYITLRQAVLKDSQDQKYGNRWTDRLDSNHPVLTNRRYSPCVSDLKCVLNVDGMSRRFCVSRRRNKCGGNMVFTPEELQLIASTFKSKSRSLSSKSSTATTTRLPMDSWIEALILSQAMDEQTWRMRHQGHVEMEPRGWVGAFNLSISLGSLFERILAWEDAISSDTSSKIEESSSTSEESKHKHNANDTNTTSCMLQTAFGVMLGILSWQQQHVHEGQYQPTAHPSLVHPPPSNIVHHTCAPAALPVSTTSVQFGMSRLCLPALSVMQLCPVSFHFPLHRFLACCLRELCRGTNNVMVDLTESSNSSSVSGPDKLVRHMIHWSCRRRAAMPSSMTDNTPFNPTWPFRRLLEFPVLVLSRAAQIRANLWRRNGPGMQDQVLNYVEPPFCRALRDADLLLVQYAVLGYRPNMHKDSNNSSNNNEENKESVGCAYVTNLLLHRFGVFAFAGFQSAPSKHLGRYGAELEANYYDAENLNGADPSVLVQTFTTVGNNHDVSAGRNGNSSGDDDDDDETMATVTEESGGGDGVDADDSSELKAETTQQVPKHKLLPWTYSPADHVSKSTGKISIDIPAVLALFEELLHLFIILITELPPLPLMSGSNPGEMSSSSQKSDQAKQARSRLRREVIHRLASGPKPFSELAEVHHVLSQRDNAALSEEGRLQNPDEAAEAALHSVLLEVANELPARGFDSKRWELKKEVWVEYDPAFFHVGLRAHQSAAELRPSNPKASSSNVNDNPSPFCPRPAPAHPYFERLRRDFTADATLLAMVYRVVHVHCSSSGKIPLPIDSNDVRGVAAYEKDALSETALARSVHILNLGAYAWENNEHLSPQPEWRKYGGGGEGSIFFDYSESLAPGAKDWVEKVLLMKPSLLLCDSFYENEDCALILLKKLATTTDGGSNRFVAQDAALRSGAAWICEFAMRWSSKAADMLAGQSSGPGGKGKESDLERRKREAKEKYMKMMSAKATNFMSQFPEMFDDEKGDEDMEDSEAKLDLDADQNLGSRRRLEGSFSKEMSFKVPAKDIFDGEEKEKRTVAPLRERPRCIICNADDTNNAQEENVTLTELAFCGHAQASTVLKGGGGPCHSTNRYVGTHVALCGHAIHHSCCDAYLKSVNGRDGGLDRIEGSKRGEFRCPCCQRLSNCLVPFVDVGIDWFEAQSSSPSYLQSRQVVDEQTFMMDIDESHKDIFENMTDINSSKNRAGKLHDFLLVRGKWDMNSSNWDGQREEDDDMQTEPKKKRGNILRRHLRFRRGLLSLMKRSSRRKQKQGDISDHDAASQESVNDIFGMTDIWRQFTSRLYSTAKFADRSRLGDEYYVDGGSEFRHTLVESSLSASDNILAGEQEWESRTGYLPDSNRQNDQFAQEELISKVLLTAQSFTYSCCSEAADVRRHARLNTAGYCHKYGVSQVRGDGILIEMPEPSSADGGEQPFDGRLGKLRLFGLATMAITVTISRELVHAIFFARSLPSTNAKVGKSDGTLDINSHRSPPLYPILCSHVLTMTVAAISACCGSKISDAFDVDEGCNEEQSCVNDNDAASECVNFIKMGFLARVLQILLGSMGLDPNCGKKFKSSFLQSKNREQESQDQYRKSKEAILIQVVRHILWRKIPAAQSHSGGGKDAWTQWCCKLVLECFGRRNDISVDNLQPRSGDITMEKQFLDACTYALAAAEIFLADASLILQLLSPGVAKEGRTDIADAHGVSFDSPSHAKKANTLEKLFHWLRVESLEEILDSVVVRSLVSRWYLNSLAPPVDSHDLSLPSGILRREGVKNILREYKVNDWPLPMMVDKTGSEEEVTPNANIIARSMPQSYSSPVIAPMSPPVSLSNSVGKSPTAYSPGSSNYWLNRMAGPPKSVSSSSVPLLGVNNMTNCSTQISSGDCDRPRIDAVPTSYTDLYAKLAFLCPDSEQTALCLVCGEVLNSGGKGECTNHAMKCGAGCGIFFLLQDCNGLILHGVKAAYLNSPYVDSHGETPQYRGRPLNLDLHRYEILREMWTGHLVREKVVAERASSRQLIIPNFY